jgi:hypothetical protein
MLRSRPRQQPSVQLLAPLPRTSAPRSTPACRPHVGLRCRHGTRARGVIPGVFPYGGEEVKISVWANAPSRKNEYAAVTWNWSKYTTLFLITAVHVVEQNQGVTLM